MSVSCIAIQEQHQTTVYVANGTRLRTYGPKCHLMCEWIIQLRRFFRMNQSESNRNHKTKSDKSPHYYVYVYWHLLSDFSRINHKTKYKSCCHSSKPPPSLRVWLVGGIKLKSFQSLRITEAQAWLRAALWTTDVCETGWQISAARCTLSGAHWQSWPHNDTCKQEQQKTVLNPLKTYQISPMH